MVNEAHPASNNVLEGRVLVAVCPREGLENDAFLAQFCAAVAQDFRSRLHGAIFVGNDVNLQAPEPFKIGVADFVKSFDNVVPSSSPSGRRPQQRFRARRELLPSLDLVVT